MIPDLIYVPDMGQIGAGQVVEFTPREKKLIIRPNNTTESDFIFTHDVSGDSLYNPDDPTLSAYNGDTLICKGVQFLHEITPRKVCVVFIKTTCERLAKRVQLVDDRVFLNSLNPMYPQRRFSASDIEIKGIVLAVQRSWAF